MHCLTCVLFTRVKFRNYATVEKHPKEHSVPFFMGGGWGVGGCGGGGFLMLIRGNNLE